MDKGAREKFLPIIKDGIIKSEWSDYSIFELAYLFDKIDLKNVECYQNKGKEVFSIWFCDTDKNREILSKIISDLDKFFELLDDTPYVSEDGSYELAEFIEGANDYIEYEDKYYKLGYRYHESSGKKEFYTYNEFDLSEIPFI